MSVVTKHFKADFRTYHLPNDERMRYALNHCRAIKQVIHSMSIVYYVGIEIAPRTNKKVLELKWQD